jgi:hypothetical protein
MRSSRALTVSAAAVLILTLTACTDAPSADDTASVDTPLTPYYEALYGSEADYEQMQEDQEAVEAKIQEKIAECMTEEGFEYTAVVPDSGNVADMSSSDGDADVWKPDDRKWVEKWGYGIVDWPGREEDEAAEQELAEDVSDDPNYAYYDSLADGERAAYDEALSGPLLDEEVYDDPDYEYKWEEGGCYGRASHEVEGDDAGEDPLLEYQDLLARMSEIWEVTENDPETVALDAEWATCMSDAGESAFDSPYEAQESISADYQELSPTPVDPGPEDASVDAAGVEEPDLSPDTNPDVAALHEREIVLALADLACREQSSYADEMQRISIAVEQRFVDENKAELEAMKLAAEQAR